MESIASRQAPSVLQVNSFIHNIGKRFGTKLAYSGFWRLEDKIGCSLDEIHTRGRVPQFETKLKFSMER
jgi:hypothetical protein